MIGEPLPVAKADMGHYRKHLFYLRRPIVSKWEAPCAELFWFWHSDDSTIFSSNDNALGFQLVLGFGAGYR